MSGGVGGRPSVAILLSGQEKFSSFYGGATARWTYEVYRRIQDRFNVTVFGFPTRAVDAYPLPHKTSSAWRPCTWLAQIPLARRHHETLWLRALIARLHRFDMLHIHNRPQWVAVLRSMGYRGAIVLHLHNDHLGHWSSPQLDALAGKLESVAVCSQYLRSTFASKSAALNGKTCVVHNGADLNKFYPREEIREAKTIFFAGRFDPEKGVLQLLQAYDKALDHHPDAKLVIGGGTGFGTHRETPYVRQVRQLAQSINQRKRALVTFLGYLDHDKDLPSCFQKASMFACPSLFQEPFGMVNAEAMACATPVVASNRGGISEVLGDTGRLIDPENIEEFAAAISELLASPQSRNDLGSAGYERCKQMFDWQVTAENWIKLLDLALSRKSCDPL